MTNYCVYRFRKIKPEEDFRPKNNRNYFVYETECIETFCLEKGNSLPEKCIYCEGIIAEEFKSENGDSFYIWKGVTRGGLEPPVNSIPTLKANIKSYDSPRVVKKKVNKQIDFHYGKEAKKK